MRKHGIIFALTAVMIGLSGCMYWEPVDERDLRVQQDVVLRRELAETRREKEAKIAELEQQVAGLRMDLTMLQDVQRQLLGQMAALQEAETNRAGQVQELRSLMAALETRMQNVDADWRNRMTSLKSNMEAQRRAELKKMASATGQEIQKAIAEVQAAAATQGGGTEHVVKSGHTLSAIAQAYGVTVKQIIDANGLKNDIIRVGQRLKIPTN